MDEGRLGAVRRQQNHHRKNTIVMNDIINFQQNIYSCFLKRERQNAEAKLKSQEVFLKKSIVRNSYLLQCLDMRKQKISERAPEKQILGRYGGRPIHAYSRDVDACMAWMHPRLRRLRRVERVKEKGLKLGAIMDFDTIPSKFEAILQKSPKKTSDKSTETVDILSIHHPTTTKHITTILPSTVPAMRSRKLGIATSKTIVKIRQNNGSISSSSSVKYEINNTNESRGTQTQSSNKLSQRDFVKPLTRNPLPFAKTENPQEDSTTTNTTIAVTCGDDGYNEQGRTKTRSRDQKDEISLVTTSTKQTVDCDSRTKNNVFNEKDKSVNGNYTDYQNENNKKSYENNRTRQTSLQKHNSGALKDADNNIVSTTTSPPPPQPPPLIRRPTLVLPPIRTTKEMKVHGFDGV